MARLLVLFLLFLISTYSTAYTPEAYRLRKVVIDPGHGGRDSGARGKKSHEKDIVLAVSLKVGAYITDAFPDVEVIFTRTEDVFVPLNERSRIANENGADLFISIHCNANPSRAPFGTETFVMGLHKSKENLEVAMRENAVITYEEDYTTKYEGYDPNSVESFIIFNLMQDSYLDQSLNMASLIQNEFRERANRRDRGVKQAPFLVLWRTTMPSVLVELGFISNAREEEFLMSSQGQAYLASSIFRAFRDYKLRVESRSGFTTEQIVDIVGNQGSETNSEPLETVHQNAIFDAGVQYMVQIAASKNRITTKPESFKGLGEVFEYAADGMYKYLVGSKQSYSEIVPFCNQVRKLFPDAFIVAFMDGKQVGLDQARKHTTN
jgi:N-acetylmuramoyl-L-alanine amidase